MAENVTLVFNATAKSVDFNARPPFVLTRKRPKTGSVTIDWKLAGTPGAEIVGMKMKPPWPYPVNITFTKDAASLTYEPANVDLEWNSYIVQIKYNDVTYSFDPEVGNDPPMP
jgi:hypothetical protein